MLGGLTPTDVQEDGGVCGLSAYMLDASCMVQLRVLVECSEAVMSLHVPERLKRFRWLTVVLWVRQ